MSQDRAIYGWTLGGVQHVSRLLGWTLLRPAQPATFPVESSWNPPGRTFFSQNSPPPRNSQKKNTFPQTYSALRSEKYLSLVWLGRAAPTSATPPSQVPGQDVLAGNYKGVGWKKVLAGWTNGSPSLHSFQSPDLEHFCFVSSESAVYAFILCVDHYVYVPK